MNMKTWNLCRELITRSKIQSSPLPAYQSKCEIGGKMFLLRAIVDDSVDPAVVVTA